MFWFTFLLRELNEKFEAQYLTFRLIVTDVEVVSEKTECSSDFAIFLDFLVLKYVPYFILNNVILFDLLEYVEV